jgi:hypothetical protein
MPNAWECPYNGLGLSHDAGKQVEVGSDQILVMSISFFFFFFFLFFFLCPYKEREKKNSN